MGDTAHQGSMSWVDRMDDMPASPSLLSYLVHHASGGPHSTDTLIDYRIKHCYVFRDNSLLGVCVGTLDRFRISRAVL
jgi:hypothetical protein